MQLAQSCPSQQLFPDWKKAQIHAQAVSSGRPKYQSQDTRICLCCNRLVDRQQINIGTHIKKLSFLGFGIPLFYLFLQYCIFLSLLLVVTDGIVMLERGYRANSQACVEYKTNENQETHLVKGIQLRTSQMSVEDQAQTQHTKLETLCSNPLLLISNVDVKITNAQTIARVSSFIIHLVFLIYIKFSLRTTGEYYNEASVDLADYSVVFRGLPTTISGKTKIFQELLSEVSVDQSQAIGYYDILVVPSSTQRLQILLAEKETANALYLKQLPKDPEAANYTLSQYFKICDEIQIIKDQNLEALKNDTVTSQNVIITFNYQKDRIQFLNSDNIENFKKRLIKYFGAEQSKQVIIEQALGPKEIIWHNVHKTHQHFKIFGVGLLSIIFLLVITVVFYIISLWKANLLVTATEASQKEADSAAARQNLLFATAISWLTFILIIFFNKFVMGQVLHHLTDLEKHDNKAGYAYSFALKYACGMFFTTAFMTIVIEGFTHKNYYTHRFGIIQQESMMFIFSAVLVPLIWIINPYQLLHRFNRWKYQGTDLVTQKQANHLMADYEYSVGKRYAQVIEMMWFTFLYVDLIPAGTIVIFIGLCLYYWVDKYNLLRRSSFTHNISAGLSDKISGLIDLTLFWRCLGEIIFDFQLKDQIFIHSIVLLLIAILYFFLPIKDWAQDCMGQDFNPNEKHVKDVWQTHFKHDNYRTMNPVYVEILHQNPVTLKKILLGLVDEKIETQNPVTLKNILLGFVDEQIETKDNKAGEVLK